jgi:hypothetical protein
MFCLSLALFSLPCFVSLCLAGFTRLGGFSSSNFDTSPVLRSLSSLPRSTISGGLWLGLTGMEFMF